MNRYLLVVSLVLLAGCTQESPKAAPANVPNATFSKAQFLLETEPEGAKGVIEIRENAKNEDEVIVVGRIDGDNAGVPGKAQFVIVDPSLEPCLEAGCGNPWCHVAKEELNKARVLVKFLDREGAPIQQDSRDLFGYKKFQTVIVKGKARRDPDGHMTAVVASAMFMKDDGQ